MFWLLCFHKNHSVPKVYNMNEELLRLDLLVYVHTSKTFNSSDVWISSMVFFLPIKDWVMSINDILFRLMTEVFFFKRRASKWNLSSEWLKSPHNWFDIFLYGLLMYIFIFVIPIKEKMTMKKFKVIDVTVRIFIWWLFIQF